MRRPLPCCTLRSECCVPGGGAARGVPLPGGLPGPPPALQGGVQHQGGLPLVPLLRQVTRPYIPLVTRSFTSEEPCLVPSAQTPAPPPPAGRTPSAGWPATRPCASASRATWAPRPAAESAPRTATAPTTRPVSGNISEKSSDLDCKNGCFQQ